MLPERTDVLVVGAGPTGLTAALTLARRGVEVTVVDKRERPAETSRAAVVHAYTLEVLDRIGAGGALVARGLRSARFSVRDRDRVLVTVPFGGLPSRHRYALMVSQSVTEEVLTERLAEAGVPVLRPYRLTGLHPDGDGAVADLDGTNVRARWVVGADGINSTVRELAGITFTGPAGSEESFVLADVRVDSGLPRDGASIFLARGGPLVWAPLPTGGYAWSPPSPIHPPSRTRATCNACSTSAAPDNGRTRCARCSGPPASGCTDGSPGRSAPDRCCWPAMPDTCTARPAGRA